MAECQQFFWRLTLFWWRGPLVHFQYEANVCVCVCLSVCICSTVPTVLAFVCVCSVKKWCNPTPSDTCVSNANANGFNIQTALAYAKHNIANRITSHSIRSNCLSTKTIQKRLVPEIMAMNSVCVCV